MGLLDGDAYSADRVEQQLGEQHAQEQGANSQLCVAYLRILHDRCHCPHNDRSPEATCNDDDQENGHQ